MTEKDYQFFLVDGVKWARSSKATDFSPLPSIRYGTKILNLKNKEIGLLICIWKNKFADADVDYATCVDKQGNKYNIELDNIEVLDDFYKANQRSFADLSEPVSVMEERNEGEK